MNKRMEAPIQRAVTSRLQSILFPLYWVLWGAAVLVLPISSFPFFAQLEGARTVAPLSLAFFGLLGLLWVVDYWAKGGWLPHESKPLLGFAWVVGISWAASFFLEAPTFRSLTALNRSSEAVITFVIGMGVYLISAAWLSDHQCALKRTVRLLHLGGAIMLAWSMVQVYYVFARGSSYPPLLYDIQRLVSSSGASLFQGRVTGLAYEPSWLAHQLNLIYLPFWLAASLSGQSAFRRIGPFSVENLLLILGGVVLLASFSRVGWLSFGMVLLAVIIAGLAFLIRRLHQRWLGNYPGGLKRRFLSMLLVAGMILVAVSLSVIFGYLALKLAFRFEPRLERILELNPLAATSFYDFANRLIIGERVIYWSAGLEIFNQYPFLGVGIGNAGLYFPQKLPAFGWWLSEVLDLIYRLPFSLNIKSFWIRLLAETGIVGFVFFCSWYATLARAGFTAWRSADPLIRMLGLAGLFMLIGFLAEGFSVDSFALPYLWFSAALLSAAAFWARRQASEVQP